MERCPLQLGRRFSAAAVLVMATWQPLSAQSRADSLAVISTSLARFERSVARLYLHDDAPALVLEAAALLPDRISIIPDGQRVFCDEELAKPGEPVGLRVDVSVTPWRDPPEAPASQAGGTGATGPPPPDTTARDSTPPFPAPPGSEEIPLSELTITAAPETPESSSAFYLVDGVAYVTVGGGCLETPSGGVGMTVELVDGRVGSTSYSELRFELKRIANRWVVVRRLRGMVL